MKSETGIVQQINQTLYIRVPVDVARDSTFPFKARDPVKVSIDGVRLVVEHVAPTVPAQTTT